MSLNRGPVTPRTGGGIDFLRAAGNRGSLHDHQTDAIFTVIFLLILPIAASGQWALAIGKLSDDGTAILAKIERETVFHLIRWADYPLTVLRESLK